MKLTDKQQKVFEALSKSNNGEVLTEYLEGLVRYVCDSRNWDKDITKEHANFAADVIEKNLINKLRKRNEKENSDPNEYL